MKKILYPILSLILLFTTSCDGWLNVNDDPNSATTVKPELLYNYAMMSWAGNRCSGDLYYPLAFAGQTLSTGGSQGWGNINVYDVSVYSLGNTWKVFYASAGANLKQAIQIAEETGDVNSAAQCKIAFAQLLYSGTVLYGDIPYSEAWDVANIDYPKFDSQKDILEDLLSVLDEAIAQINPSKSEKISKYDLSYSGDMDKWKRYAKSLKFKIAMVMVDKDPTKSSLIAALLKDNNMISSAADNFQIPFENVGNKENPKFKMLKQYMSGKNLEFFANAYVLNPMKAKNDPRLPKYFDKGSKATEFIGTGTNEEGIKDVSSMISLYLYRADAPEYFFTYQEQLFLEAEAYARGLGVAKDITKANQLYKQAMVAAMSLYEVDKAAIDKYVAEELSDLTKISDPLKEIHLQQWIDLMDRPLDAFTQWRRSGNDTNKTPALTVPRRASPAQLFRRYKYSPDEATANPNTPEQDSFVDKLWFEL